MPAAWNHQTTTTGRQKKVFFLGIQKGRWALFVAKFEHGFGTQLGAVLLHGLLRQTAQLFGVGGRGGSPLVCTTHTNPGLNNLF